MTALGMKISLIIPTLNEIGSIERVLREVPRDVVDEILVVDGHSTDGTAELVTRLGYEVIEQEGTGYGAAIATGLKRARGNAVVLVDGDGSYNLADIPRLVQRLMEGADVVLGSRYLPESGSEDDTIIRYVGNKIFTYLLCKIHGVASSDCLFFYAAIRREVFESILVESTGFGYIVEFLIKAHWAGFKFAEIPSAERRRAAGKSKVNALYDGLRILAVILREVFSASRGRPRM